MASDKYRVHDHAKDILFAANGVQDAVKASAYDYFHDTKNTDELRATLQGFDASHLPDDVKQKLLDAKKLSTTPTREPEDILDKILPAMLKLQKSGALDVAEKHPHVMRHLTDAAIKKE